MFLPSNQNAVQRRSGIILLVVITMLALFAVMGLTFVYYAQAEAEAARLSTQSQSQTAAVVDQEFLVSFALGQLLYDLEDKVEYGVNHNVSSALRGHSLARNMYGYNRNSLNVTPFNGVGRPSATDPNVLSKQIDKLVNYQYFPSDNLIRDPGRYGSGAAWKNRDNTLLPLDPTDIYYYIKRDPINPYTGENVDYTYADLQNFYLGQILNNGDIIARSFWRDWTLDTAASDSLDPNAPNNKLWQAYDPKNPAAFPPADYWKKYATLRPLPWFNRGDPAIALFPLGLPGTRSGSTGFLPPEDGGGDVRLVDSATGISNGAGGYYNNDSIWIDLGFPVMTAPDGRKYKPLFAFFICDLDGKVNLNTAGNLRRQENNNYQHASHQGLGPWEINPSHLLDPSLAANNDWRNFLAYRYDRTFTPGTALNPSNTNPGNTGWIWGPGFGPAPPFYCISDLDGIKDDFTSAERFYLPGETNNTLANQGTANQGKLIPFPQIPGTTYGRGSGPERLNHPGLFNPFNPGYTLSAGAGGDGTAANDRRFIFSQLEGLYRYNGTGSPSLTAELFSFLPKIYSATNSAPKRFGVTLHSADLNRPGLTPWLNFDPANPTTYSYKLASDKIFPSGSFQASANATNSGEYGSDTRGAALLASFKRMYMQGILDPNYPGTFNEGYCPLWNYPPTEKDPKDGHDLGYYDFTKTQPNIFIPSLNMTVAKTYKQMYDDAVRARQTMAQAFFDRLKFVTMGARPNDWPLNVMGNIDRGSDAYRALRWLAQLSVNMVDYLDVDNINSYFIWDPTNPALADPDPDKREGFVVGTELPRLMLNEVYAEISNDKNDASVGTGNPAASDYKVNFWVELINPLLLDPLTNNAEDTQARLEVVVQGGTGSWPVYKIAILNGSTSANTGVFTPDDPLGTPKKALIKTEVSDYDPNGKTGAIPAADDPLHFTVLPLNQDFLLANKQGKNFGFYMLSPQTMMINDPFGAMVLTPTLQVSDYAAAGVTRNSLTYEWQKGGIEPAKVPAHTVVLRRLANPALPWDASPISPTFNPYVTVDYLDNVPVNDGTTNNNQGQVMQDDANAIIVHNQTIRTPVEKRCAVGRKQPYAAMSSYYNATTQQYVSLFTDNFNTTPPSYDGTKSQVQFQATALMGQPQHTFFSHNTPVESPFEWLAHLDRFVTSPIELLQVSGFRPTDLTQRFVSLDDTYTNVKKQNHLVDWTNSDRRIYRLLEYLDSGFRPNGATRDGVTLGKININTIWDKEPLLALCDPQTNSYFKAQNVAGFSGTDIAAVFDMLKKSRSSNKLYPNSTDVPFRSLAAPYMTNNVDGVEYTILRKDPDQPQRRLFELKTDAGNTDPTMVVPDHPVVKSDLLAKIFNNMTTRSNVFAVWMCVGYFEAFEWPNLTADVGKYPNWNNLPGGMHWELGREIGRDENRHVRHRMFAIIDRTALIMPETPALLAAPIPAAGVQTIPIRRVQLISPNRVDFKLQAGMVLELDGGANLETITIMSADYTTTPPTIKANFQKPHGAGAPISVPQTMRVSAPSVGALVDGMAGVQTVNTVYGNPGPQLRFDHRQATYLVPYYSIIQ